MNLKGEFQQHHVLVFYCSQGILSFLLFCQQATASIEEKLALLWSMVSELSSIIMRGKFFIRVKEEKKT